MKILMRNAERKWQKLEPFSYSNENQLESLLEESPDLLPADEGRPILFLRRQFPLGSNAVDLVGVDQAEKIAIVECKLEANREARRMVVGQILEYAAQLRGMEIEEFEGLMTIDPALPFARAIKERISTVEWSEEQFRYGIRTSLETGNFRLVIAVNGITQELKEILEYLRARGGVSIEALELRQFTYGTYEVLVPEMYGQDSVLERSTAVKGQLRTINEVCANAKDAEAGTRLRRFVDAWCAAGHEAVPRTSGISFRVAVQGEPTPVPLFQAQTPDYFAFNRGLLAARGIPQQRIEEFLGGVGGLPSADPQKFASQSEPRLIIERMSDEDVDRLANLAITFVRDWQEGAGTRTQG
jgi:hypothetical protein